MRLHRADVRFRGEALETAGVEIDIKNTTNNITMSTKDKWTSAWMMAMADTKWWKTEFEDPALALRLHLRKVNEVVGSDARIAASNHGHVASNAQLATWASSSLPQPPPPATITPIRPAGIRHIQNKSIALARVVNGVYVTNQRGEQICAGFSDGSCPGLGRCPDQKGTPQCNKCLQTSHGAHNTQMCPKAGGAAVQKGKENGKDKGTGKGRSKGCNSWYNQW